MDNNLIIYLNGQFLKQSEAKISVFDQGILFGDGVFEGIRVYNRKTFNSFPRVCSNSRTPYLQGGKA